MSHPVAPQTLHLQADDPLAISTIAAIRSGNLAQLRELLDMHPGLAQARIWSKPKTDPHGEARTLLHIATDFPGHFPNVAATVRLLIDAGSDPNAPFVGGHCEPPLHWAASSNDVEALDALIDGGADIEAPGSVISGGSALADAVAFGQWDTARRLVERGAMANLWQAAALGLMDRLEADFARETPQPSDVTNAFWCACHGGQRDAVAYLLARGADVNWIGHDRLTPLDAAKRSGAADVVAWLRTVGARSAKERT